MDKIKKSNYRLELQQQQTLGVTAAQKAEIGAYSQHMKKYQECSEVPQNSN